MRKQGHIGGGHNTRLKEDTQIELWVGGTAPG